MWQRLTVLDSWLCEPTRKKYITPKSPGVPLAKMPLGAVLDAVAVKKLETWIQQGAPNN